MSKKSVHTERCDRETATTDVAVHSQYVAGIVKASRENGLFMSAVSDAISRAVANTENRLSKSTSEIETLAIVLNGGWLKSQNDGARSHSGQALKASTWVTLNGARATLSISIECRTERMGGVANVVLVPVIFAQRFHCATCYSETVRDLEPDTFYSLPVSYVVGYREMCYVCKGMFTSGELLKRAYHVATGKTKVARGCSDKGCPDMELRGVVLGNVLDLTPESVVSAIRSLRATITETDDLESLLDDVKAIDQFNPVVKYARNLWKDAELIHRPKSTLIEVTL